MSSFGALQPEYIYVFVAAGNEPEQKVFLESNFVEGYLTNKPNSIGTDIKNHTGPDEFSEVFIPL